MRNRKQQKGYITIALIIANVAVFFGLTIFGMTEDPEYMLQHGAMYVPYFTDRGEFYRLFSCMFMHFGFEHLVNNMVALLVFGWNLELEIGRVKYLFIYLGSGLLGNIVSALFEIQAARYSVSAGASGAVFGLIGALLYVVIRNKGQLGNITGRGLLLMIGMTLYYGFTSTGVDNAAHIGGLIFGFLLSALVYRKRKGKSRSVEWNG